MSVKRSGDVCTVVVTAGIAGISLVAWAWLAKGEFGGVDSLSSVGLLVMAVIVGVGIVVEWLHDWRMFRTLRRHLDKMRADGQREDPRGPKGNGR
jgi:hypothetical protein